MVHIHFVFMLVFQKVFAFGCSLLVSAEAAFRIATVLVNIAILVFSLFDGVTMLAGWKILGRNAQGTVVILLLVLCSPVYTYSAYSGEAVDDGGGYDDDFEFFDSVDIAVDPATLRSSFAIDWGIDSHEDCTNPFTCLISNIKIYNTKNIIIRPKALVKVTLSNVTCYGLSLGLGPGL